MRHRIVLCLTIVMALIAGGVSSLARADGMQYPLTAVTVGPDLFVADLNLPGVWKVSEGTASVYFQASKKFRTPLNRVRCLAVDHQGKLLAGDSATREVYRFDEKYQPQPLTNGGIGIPMDIAADPDGNLFVTDLELHWVFKIAAGASKAEKYAEVPAPRGLAIDSDRNLWVVSAGPNQLVKITPDGKSSIAVAGRPFEFPHEVELDKDKNAFISDGYAHAVWKVPLGGKPEKWIDGKPLDNPVGLTWRQDTLLIIDPRANAIFTVGTDRKLTPIPLKFDTK